MRKRGGGRQEDILPSQTGQGGGGGQVVALSATESRMRGSCRHLRGLSCAPAGDRLTKGLLLHVLTCCLQIQPDIRLLVTVSTCTSRSSEDRVGTNWQSRPRLWDGSFSFLLFHHEITGKESLRRHGELWIVRARSVRSIYSGKLRTKVGLDDRSRERNNACSRHRTCENFGSFACSCVALRNRDSRGQTRCLERHSARALPSTSRSVKLW